MYQNKLEDIVKLINKSTMQNTNDIETESNIDDTLDSDIENTKEDMELSL